MGCLNCNNELKHTPGKRKKQFCNPDCRVRYWQKNKPKKGPVADPLSDLINVRKEQDAFCEKRGFPTTELIARFGGLEAELSYYLQTPKPYDGMMQGTRMPIMDDLPAGSEPLVDFKARIKANAGKSTSNKLNATAVEENVKDKPKNKPAELSPFLKSRQNLKNGIK